MLWRSIGIWVESPEFLPLRLYGKWSNCFVVCGRDGWCDDCRTRSTCLSVFHLSIYQGLLLKFFLFVERLYLELFSIDVLHVGLVVAAVAIYSDVEYDGRIRTDILRDSVACHLMLLYQPA